MRRCALLVVAAAVVVAAHAGVAAAADTPAVGTTTTTLCAFDPQTWTDAGTTSCNSDSVTIDAGACVDVGVRRYFTSEVFSTRVYQGMAVSPSLNGVGIAGYEQVRPNARLVFDSGPHADAGSSFTADDPSCT